MRMRHGKRNDGSLPANCELYDEERDVLGKIGMQEMNISTLLGGDNKIVKEIIEYMEKTGGGGGFKLDH